MSEIIALARLAIVQSRLTLIVSAIYFVIIHLAVNAVALASDSEPERTRELFATLSGFFSLPLLLMTFGLFGFSEHSDLNSGSSGYSSWLLRTPIPAWKLAMVPSFMKTVWVIAVCGTVAFTARQVGISTIRWLLPSIALAAVFIAPTVLLWFPFRWQHARLVLFTVLFLPAYAWFLSWLTFAFEAQESDLAFLWGPTSTMWLIGGSAYALTIWMAIRAVRSARCNAGGSNAAGWASSRTMTVDPRQLKATGRLDSTIATPNATAERIHFRKPATASGLHSVLRFERMKLASVCGGVMLTVWLLCVAWACTWRSIDGSALIGLAAILGLAPTFLFEWTYSNLERGTLPNLLAFAPIRTTTLIWTRQATVTSVWILAMSGLLVAIGVWSITGASDNFTAGWNATMQRQFGQADAGKSVFIASVLLCAALIARQATWSTAAASLGQRRFVLYSFLGRFFIAFAVLSWFVFHFIRFPDWESWNRWAWQRLAFVPTILPYLFVIKGICVAAASVMLDRSGLSNRRTIIGILAGYVIFTALLGGTFWVLLGSDRVLLWHCLTFAAILVPATRILIAPICLARYRHR